MTKKKTTLKKIWNFLWHSDSPLSWLVNIVLAFIIIKFIIFPGAGLILGTQLPVVAVISESMVHVGGEDWIENPANCERGICTQEAWYIEKGINFEDFKEFPFSKGFNKGDIMIIKGKKTEDISVGDVIVFQTGREYPIIHRVVEIKNESGTIFFETKGDNNREPLVARDINEKSIREDTVFGVATARIPFLGYLRIWATDLVNMIRSIF